eukprot:6208764-Pleurochrysis_carterae.AAC.1
MPISVGCKTYEFEACLTIRGVDELSRCRKSRFATITITTTLAFIRVQPAAGVQHVEQRVGNVAALLAATAVSGSTVRSTNANPASLPHASLPSPSVHKGDTFLFCSFGRASQAGAASNGSNRKGQSGTGSGGGVLATVLSTAMNAKSTTMQKTPASRKRSAYGASSKRSRDSASSCAEDDVSSCASHGKRSATSSASSRKHRVKHVERARDLVERELIKKHVFGEHKCKNTFEDSGEEIPCHRRVGAVSNATAV